MLVSRRYERASLIVTSNRSARGRVFGDDMAAVAMVDRLIHHAELISLKGDQLPAQRPRPRTTPDPARGHRLTGAPAGISLRSPTKMEGGYPLLSIFNLYAQGACGKPRVVPHNRRLRQEPTEMGVATCVCC